MEPKSIKWINKLLLLKIAIIIFLLIAVFIILIQKPNDGFWYGFGQSVFSKFNIEDPYNNVSYTISYMIGLYLIPSVIIIGQFIMVNRRKKVAFWILLFFDFMVTLSMKKPPLISLVILILSLRRSSRDFLTAKEDIISSDTLDGDLLNQNQ